MSFPFLRIWQYIKPTSQPQNMYNHVSPGPPHLTRKMGAKTKAFHFCSMSKEMQKQERDSKWPQNYAQWCKITPRWCKTNTETLNDHKVMQKKLQSDAKWPQNNVKQPQNDAKPLERDTKWGQSDTKQSQGDSKRPLNDTRQLQKTQSGCLAEVWVHGLLQVCPGAFCLIIISY